MPSNQMPAERPTNKGLIILDYGSQYTLLIARRLRECGVYSEIIDGHASECPKNFEASAIVLSGGPASVTEQTSRKIPRWVIDANLPLLGICYGMQLLVEEFGGSIRSAQQREYGKATLNTDEAGKNHPLFGGLPAEQVIWMSHGDDLETLPEQFDLLATTSDGVAAAIAHKDRPIVGLQFHPEVQHTEFGKDILSQFVRNIAKAPFNWNPGDMLEATTATIKRTVGDGKVLMGVSGGVDSTVATVLLTKALSAEQVVPVFVDTGMLRHGERELVTEALTDLGLNNLVVLDRKREFISALKGVTDPEKKRKIIGRLFYEEFEKYAQSLQGLTHLGQGTLYPDVIESAGHGSGAKVIKTHHNVGGLPDELNLALVEPFRFCFKDEVRAIGRQLGIPANLVGRHPFPGPGLAVRLPGEVTDERLEVLRAADHIFIEKLREFDLYDQVWQAFAVLLPVKTVGVMGDNRTYQWACALRAVTATDAMTAEAAALPHSFLTHVADQIVRQVDGINRVLFDITTKPPATIEWE